MSVAANIIDNFRFLSYNLRYSNRRDILRQSFGIARRARDFASAWELHHAQCRSFLRESIALAPRANSINIIGAGRLLDLDQDFLTERMKQIRLVDIDPSLHTQWRKFATRASRRGCLVTMEERDITGIFDRIPALLNDTLADLSTNLVDSAAQRLSDALSIIEPVSLPAAEVTLSLNILSQLPILFRERIVHVLCKYGVMAADGELPGPLGEVLAKCCCAINQVHLQTLINATSGLIVLITDKQFEYYQPNTDKRQIEPALYLDITDAMHDQTLKLQTEWMWHIAPYGKNPENYGSEHLVGAWAWIREAESLPRNI